MFLLNVLLKREINILEGENMKKQEIDLSGEWTAVLNDGLNRGTRYVVTLPSSLDEYRIGNLVEQYSTEHLTRYVTYEGKVTYSRTLCIPEEWNEKTIFLKLERSRVTQVAVDRKTVGENDSLVCSQTYDLTGLLTPGEHYLEVSSDNSRSVMDWESVRFSHIAVEHTQTNWNGILGEIKLTALPANYLDRIKIYASKDKVHLTVETVNTSGREKKAKLLLQLEGRAETLEQELKLLPGRQQISIVLDAKEPIKEWSEFHPNLNKAILQLKTEDEIHQLCQQFGVRDFKVEGKKFSINGHKTFLRGKHDGCVFPLTGYAPMEEEEWMQVFEKAKNYGINHYRFHSWCPPEAAFAAADRYGIYMQPELPYWNPSSAFEKDEEWIYFKREALHILDCYGNHPSFVMFAWGNELSGNERRMEELVDLCRSYDNRHLYSIGSNNFLWHAHQPVNSDYWTTFWTEGDWNSKHTEYGGKGVRASTPHSTRGHINNNPPSTCKNYDWEIENNTLPVIGHEVGQFQVYPDFEEIQKYKGILRAGNLEIFRKKMELKGMLPLNKDFAYASGKLALQCYREELEAALRTKDFGGIQLLDLQDFPGQGTALVGILDSFMEEKCFTDAREWRSFCSETVLLVELPRYIWKAEEILKANVLVAHYGEEDLQGHMIVNLCSRTGLEIWKEDLGVVMLEAGKLNCCDKLRIQLPDLSKPEKYILTVKLENSTFENSYPIWIFPEVKEIRIPLNVYVTKEWNEDTRNAAENGKRIFWMPDTDTIRYGVEGAFITDFWCYPMFKKYSPPGTMGILCDKNHPAFKSFPTENYSEWLWWNLVKNGKSVILDGTDAEPVVRTIDNVARQKSLGLITEGKWKEAGVLICGIRLMNQLDRPEAAALYQSLLDYIAGDSFKPRGNLLDAFFDRILTADPEDEVVGNKDTDIFG